MLQRREERPRADSSQVPLPLPVRLTLRPEIIQTRPTVASRKATAARKPSLATDGPPATPRAAITLRAL
jgi:hypothetical protein